MEGTDFFPVKIGQQIMRDIKKLQLTNEQILQFYVKKFMLVFYQVME